ncbi:Elongation of very long chain fatty acids protein 7, partial [Stegodyphus mimosarum]
MLILQKIDNFLEETFNTGDKEIRTWFLVQQNLLPFALCGSYTLFVLLIGPAIMKNRKPFVMRMPMIIYNLFLVVVYTVSLTIIFTNLPYISPEVFCKGGSVRKGDLTYKITSCCWVIYILKYVQFLDTVFFILRKKWHLVTFLHVFHHSVVPLIGWVILRTETS